MGALYKITLPNGKGYVGLTVSNPGKRFAEHRYQARTGCEQAVHRAMLKHGGAKFEVLVIANGRGYLEELERQAIVAFGTRSPAGYNCTDGGDGAPVGNQFQLGKRRSDESRARMSAAAMGRKHTSESKAKIGAASKGNKHAFGRMVGEDERMKRSKGATGKSHGATSGHVGISFCKQTGKWRAHITVGGKMIHLGRFWRIEDAITARTNKECAT